METPLDSKLGAALLGNIAAAIFYGITSVQTFIYFTNSSQDKLILKFLIFFLWILDTVHIAFITHILYFYVIINSSNLQALMIPIWSVMGQVFVTCLSDLIIRSIFAYRVWLLSGKKNYLVFIIMILALLSAADGNAFAVKAFDQESYADFRRISSFMYTALPSGAAADIVIAASLVVLLLRSRTGFRRTDSLLYTLMVYAINTGLISVVCRLMCLITYVIWPDEFIFMAIYFVVSELSLNALLATLNARSALRDKSHGVSTVPLELVVQSDLLTTAQQSSESYDETHNLSNHHKIIVKVDQQIETVVETHDSGTRHTVL